MNQPTHKFMMALTEDMPCKQINIHKPYLQRYYAGSLSETHDLWFHRFLSNDSERHVHSHPFEFRTTILCGGYSEEILLPNGHKSIVSRMPSNISMNDVSEYCFIATHNLNMKMQLPPGRNFDLYHWHRIVEVEPETWTMIIVDKRRLKTWNFMDDQGNIETVFSSAQEWYKQYNRRGLNPGDAL